MLKVSKKKWNNIDDDYKGTWNNYYNDHPEWTGRKVVMSGCVTDDPQESGKLLIEDVHFIIED